MIASQGIGLVIQIVVMAVLARLLSPRDFGLAAMVMVVYAFANLFGDLGFSAATIQKTEVSQQQKSTLFWINVAFGLVLSLGCAAASPLVAWFFKEDTLYQLNIFFASGFIFTTLGVQHRAQIQKQMRYGTLVVISLVATAVSSAAAIGAADAGWGPYALAVQFLSRQVIGTLSFWIFSGWTPGLPARGSGIRSMLRFGGFLTGTRILNYAINQFDRIVIGRLIGTDATGLYTRAQNLVLFPYQIVGSPLDQVMFPALSAIQDDLPRAHRAFGKAMRYMLIVTMPMMVWLGFTAEDSILLVYGDQWQEAVPLFQILCLFGLWQPVQGALSWVFLSSGRTDRIFFWLLFEVPIVMVCCLVGSHWGARGVAIGFTVSKLTLAAPYLKYSLSTIKMTVHVFGKEVWPPVVASIPLTALLFTLESTDVLSEWSRPGRLSVEAAAGVVTYFASLTIASRGTVTDLRDTIALALFRRK